MNQRGIILFNPRSADAKHRIPNSILQIGASIEGLYNYHFVDGNLEEKPLEKILKIIQEEVIEIVGMTVMPGPQLKQAIPFAKAIKQQHPNIKIVWGGYFASNQYKVVLTSGYVDFVINGPGDTAFPMLCEAIFNHDLSNLSAIHNLIYYQNNEFIKTKKETIPNMEQLNAFPYKKLNESYPLANYLAKTFMGNTTFSYHSSFGCPFTCSFCAVVPIYNARWKGLKAERIAQDVLHFKQHYNIDAVEFHDNNFFTARKRVVKFSKQIENEGISWWGERKN